MLSPWVGCTWGWSGLFLLVQVGVWIDVGSRYENEKNNGAGYFVEHLAFKVSSAVPPLPPRGKPPPQLGLRLGRPLAGLSGKSPL